MKETQRREDAKDLPQFGGGDGSNAQPFGCFAGMFAAAAMACLFFSGCAAREVTPEHENPNVQTRMSKKVSLEDKKPSDHTLFLDLKYFNIQSHFPSLDIEGSIRRRLEAKGYQMRASQAEAYYILKVNVRRVGMSESWVGAINDVGDIVGAPPGILPEDPQRKGTMRMVTDLEILERSGEKVAQMGGSNERASERKKYRTEIVSTATRVTYERGLPLLAESLAESIAGIF